MHKWIYLFLIVSLPHVLLAGGKSKAIPANIVYDPQNCIQNAITAAKTARLLQVETDQLAQQFKTYEKMLEDGASLPSCSWTHMASSFLNLRRVVKQSEELAHHMQNLDAIFSQNEEGNFFEIYNNWLDLAMTSQKQSLEEAGIDLETLGEEQEMIEELHRLSKSAKGKRQAIEIGNAIANHHLHQLTQLRLLMTRQMEAQNTYFAYQLKKEEQEQMILREHIENLDSSPKDYRDKGLSLIPTFYP